MHKHSLRIDYDESTGAVLAVHRCTATAGGHEVSHAEDIKLTAEVGRALKAIVEVNKDAIEAVASARAVQHAAALVSAAKTSAVKLNIGGTIAAEAAQAMNPKSAPAQAPAKPVPKRRS